MKPETVIKVENLSKQYRLGNVGLGSLGADVNRWWQTKILGNEDPYLKIGEENNREVIGNSEYVWALRDINFEVEQGEVLGIIGRNGAGKSTLLKILSRTTGPTTGSIKIKGRVASLLEVGTGFHPELTGRENIFLNGAILGMTKDEIRRKFDEIVAFAGVDRYVDTPVKRYSSGMYVRLAFAVAAHLEPEILIVDEVLAVGDAEFQKKAIGKMKEVSEGQGRTVLFVSHNMVAVRSLCVNGLVLENGFMKYQGSSSMAVSQYLKGGTESMNRRRFGDEFDTEDFKLDEISLNPKGETSDSPLDEYHEIEINIVIYIKKFSERRKVTLVLVDEKGDPIFTFTHLKSGVKLRNGPNHLVCFLPRGFLNVGNYSLSFYLIQDSKESIFVEKGIISFDIQEGKRNLGGWMGREPGIIKPTFRWENYEMA
ncbi:MAG: ATP-binding cassette domain-containing protein [Chitinophagaceae bacterium]|nr:ATP-binding cassette domain-containing protein [Chitinophagaceae bacterium]